MSSKKINRKKWTAGNVLYSELNNELYIVRTIVLRDKGARGIAVVDSDDGLSLLSVWPENTPGVDVWKKVGSL
jgi:hypothetical protein